MSSFTKHIDWMGVTAVGHGADNIPNTVLTFKPDTHTGQAIRQIAIRLLVNNKARTLTFRQAAAPEFLIKYLPADNIEVPYVQGQAQDVSFNFVVQTNLELFRLKVERALRASAFSMEIKNQMPYSDYVNGNVTAARLDTLTPPGAGLIMSSYVGNGVAESAFESNIYNETGLSVNVPIAYTIPGTTLAGGAYVKDIFTFYAANSAAAVSIEAIMQN